MIHLQLSERVATVTLTKPERMNAIGAQGWADLHRAFGSIERDPSIRAVVLTGAGDHFCSGADLKAPAERLPAIAKMQRVNEAIRAVHRCTRPVVARVRGVAVGAGWNLALACDLVVADRTARFSQVFIRRGMSVDAGGSWILPRLVSPHVARRLVYLGETIDAPEASALGLVTHLVAPETLDTTVDDIVDRLADAPPVALMQSKRLLAAGLDRTLEQALDAEATAQALNSAGSETTEGRDSFRESRSAHFGNLDTWTTS